MINVDIIENIWIPALESGEYQQTKNYLRVKDGEEVRYCCLGVLSNELITRGLVDAAWEERDKLRVSRFVSKDVWTTTWLPPQICELVGLDADGGVAFNFFYHYYPFNLPVVDEPRLSTSLATLNDYGVPFAEIAQALREMVAEAKAKGCVRSNEEVTT